MDSRSRSPLVAPVPPTAVPPLPAWASPRAPDLGEADAAFAAGIALKSLDDLVRSEPAWAGCWGQRLALRCAQSAGHFIAEIFGSGTQHLAFETKDIFSTADLLQANGFAALPISPNYYGDVEARFGLDPELTEALKIRNILYDRDERGEYFQLYSPTYGEGFFVEVVERRGGYSGYGAANAIFRITALRKYLRPAGLPHR